MGEAKPTLQDIVARALHHRQAPGVAFEDWCPSDYRDLAAAALASLGIGADDQLRELNRCLACGAIATEDEIRSLRTCSDPVEGPGVHHGPTQIVYAALLDLSATQDLGLPQQTDAVANDATIRSSDAQDTDTGVRGADAACVDLPADGVMREVRLPIARAPRNWIDDLQDERDTLADRCSEMGDALVRFRDENPNVWATFPYLAEALGGEK